MRAIRVLQFGGPEKLLIDSSVPMPEMGDTDVLIRVHAAGVNPVDTYISHGHFSGIPENLPYTPGIDGAGVLEKIGKKSKKFSVGDRVFFTGDMLRGSYAEYTVRDENRCWKLPQHLTFEQGACIGVPYFTAYRALKIKVDCHSGDTILVHGASGGTGLATCQLAKTLGLKVLGTAGSDEGARVVKEQGMADQVFNHKQKNYAQKILAHTNNEGVDLVVEMAADINLERDVSLLKPEGTIAIVGSKGQTKMDPGDWIGREIRLVGVALFRTTPDEWNTAAQYISQCLENKKLNPVVDRVYPLEDASKAHHDIMHSRGAKGKLILKIA